MPRTKTTTLPSPGNRYPLIAGISIAHIIFLGLFGAVRYNYRRWLQLGAGGIPHNFLGFLMNWALYPLGENDMLSIQPYLDPRLEDRYKHAAKKRYLKAPLPWREPYGNRPFVDAEWSAPQRQCRQIGFLSEKGAEKQNALLDSFVTTDAAHLRIATSQQEKHGPALFLALNLQSAPYFKRTNGEIAHIHEEGSAHCSLTPADAMEVVEKGWGQRHRLSRWIHVGYTMIYAPRDEGEVEVLRRIFEAAVEAAVDGARPVGG